MPSCALRIHRNHRRSLWPPFHPCSAPSGAVLGLVAAIRGDPLQFNHRWNCAQQATGGYDNCVKRDGVAARRTIGHEFVQKSSTQTLLIGRQPPTFSFDKNQTGKKTKQTAKKMTMMTTRPTTATRGGRALDSKRANASHCWCASGRQRADKRKNETAS